MPYLFFIVSIHFVALMFYVVTFFLIFYFQYLFAEVDRRESNM
jgi:hypothetical protein